MLRTYLNRVVVILTMVCGLATAIAVPLANLDTSSTIGVVSGLSAIVVAAVTFLQGWQKHESRVASGRFSDFQLGKPPLPALEPEITTTRPRY